MLLNRKIKYFFVFLSLFLIPISCYALITNSSGSYVVDSANLLSKYTEDYITTYSDFFNNNNDIDYYVVCIKSFDGIDDDEYIEYVYKDFNISNKGLLILASSEDRILKVKVGEDLSNVITDDIISQYIDLYFMPYLKQGEWDLGIRNGYSSFYKLLCNYYDIDSSPMNVYTGKNILDKYRFPIITIIVFICSLLSYFISKFIMSRKNYSLICFLVIINILLLYFLFILNSISVIVALGFELFGFFDSFFLSKKH